MLDLMLHPWTCISLGAFFTAVSGRNQRQNDKCIQSENNKQN